MKKFTLLSLTGLTSLLILSSCSMDKRVYSSGYHIEWNSKEGCSEKKELVHYSAKQKNETTNTIDRIELPSLANTAEVNSDENLSASADKALIIPKSEKINFNASPAKTNNSNKAVSSASASSEVITASEIKAIAKQQKKENKKAYKHASSSASGGKSQLVALILCILLGFLGIHRFYLGYIGLGIMYLLFGLIGIPLMAVLIGIPFVAALSILVLIDLIRIIMGSLKPKNGAYTDKF